MRDDPRRNLKWLEQELLAEEEVFYQFHQEPETVYEEDDDLLELVDALIEEEEEYEEEEAPPIRNFANHYGRRQRSLQAERDYLEDTFDEGSAVLVKSRKELRREKKQRKIAEKKAGVNRNIKGLVFLAFLECVGILAIMGWWLQWLI